MNLQTNKKRSIRCTIPCRPKYWEQDVDKFLGDAREDSVFVDNVWGRSPRELDAQLKLLEWHDTQMQPGREICTWKKTVRSHHGITQVENLGVFQRYTQKVHDLRAQGEPDLDLASFNYPNVLNEWRGKMDMKPGEVLLLHGTSLEVARKIMKEGFDHRVTNTQTTHSLYGNGLYFASQICKAAQYYVHAFMPCPPCETRVVAILVPCIVPPK